MNKKKQYVFYRDVRRHVREECVIEANTLDEAVAIHNNGVLNYEEVDCFFDDIMDEGIEELTWCYILFYSNIKRMIKTLEYLTTQYLMMRLKQNTLVKRVWREVINIKLLSILKTMLISIGTSYRDN